MTEVTTGVKTITLQELQNRLRSHNPPELVNVLTEDYFVKRNGARLPKSHWVPLNEVENRFPKLFNKNREIVVYCGGGECPQSRQAAEKLHNLGYTNVLAFEGGLKEWQEAKLPVETNE